MNALKIGNKKFELGKRTIVIGILNITPDSFSDGGEHFSVDNAVKHAFSMEKNGADVSLLEKLVSLFLLIPINLKLPKMH